MNSFFAPVGGHIKKYAELFWSLSMTLRTIVLILIMIVFVFVIRLIGADENVDEVASAGRTVSVARVGDLSVNSIPLPLLGTVTSRSEATIRAETGGKIVSVYQLLGNYVAAGTIIAEFENAGERASVLQAEGAYEAANAGKAIAEISRGSSDNSLNEAKTQALNVVASTYTVLDDAIRTKTDTAWKNPQTREARLPVTIPDAKLVIELENERIAIETMLRAREERNKLLTPDSDLIKELDMVEAEANIVKDYLDDLSFAFNHALADGNASQAAIDGFKTITAGARMSVNGALSTIANTRNALNGSLAASRIAEQNSSTSGVDSGSSSDAQVKSALGNLRAAQARLEKTIIRSPINGTINSLSINAGDFISPYTEVAVVSNNGALEVVAYVTEDDARELVVGGRVTIEGGGTGTITRIAPALDPNTKKIEVRIGITKGVETLMNGSSVRLEAMRTTKKAVGTDLKIPLAALKITPEGAVVFSVSASSTLIAHEVSMGALMGDQIVIPVGLTPDMVIVTDARGLQKDMSVSLK